MDSDTICAIATAPGEAGIGVVRVSGPRALPLLEKAFKPRNSQPFRTISTHRVVLGNIVDPLTGLVLDEALCTVMRAPRSYTGEDVVELSAHGNPRILSRILELLVRLGARLAERGEFTKRAFLNGKMDLTQAEGVMDAVCARTFRGIDSALNQLQGNLGKFIKELRTGILEILSPIEAGIDFPEEDVPETPREDLVRQIQPVLHKIEKALKNASAGKIARDGFAGAIVGKPNVGKSSLLNALLREHRAIVTDVPGTTRDTIEEWVDLQGIPMRLVDTAGIRPTIDRIEEMGILRSKEAMTKADLVLLVLDRSLPLEQEDLDLLKAVEERKSLVVVNKMDLQGPLHPSDIQKLYPGPVVFTSITQNQGVQLLEQRIVETVLESNLEEPETPLVTRVRHQECLLRAKQFLEESLYSLQQGLPLDLAAGDLRGAAEALGQITGDNTTQDLLEKIFHDFCIGK